MPEKHPDAVRQEAIALTEQFGAAEAARRLGIPRGTVSGWFSKSGRGATRGEQTRAATEQHALSRDARVARLADALLREAEDEVKRLRMPVTMHKASATGKLVTWEITEPEPGDRRNIATTAAILIDKSQLLAGEATSRSEVSGPEQARQKIQELREQLSKRGRLVRVVGSD